MKRITSVTSLCGTSVTDLETLEARRLLSGTVEAVNLVASDQPVIQMSVLTEASNAQDTKMTRWIVNFERPTFELFPGGNRAVDLDAVHNPKMIIDRDTQIAELGSEIRFVRNLGHQYVLLVEAPAEMTAEQVTGILSRLDGFRSVAQDQTIAFVQPVRQTPTLTEASNAQDTKMTRWIVNFERPTFELFPGGNRAVDLDAVHNPKMIIDRDTQIAELGSEIRFVRNLGHQYVLLVEAPAEMTAEQVTGILSRLDGFRSVAQDQTIATGRPVGELIFIEQPSAGPSSSANFWGGNIVGSLVDLDDNTDDTILLLPHPTAELLG